MIPADWNKQHHRVFRGLRRVPQVLAVVEVLKNETDFDEGMIEDATRILCACVAGFLCEEDAIDPSVIKAFLRGLKTGHSRERSACYGQWLREIEAAIPKADLSERDRRFMQGAFFMARHFAYHLELLALWEQHCPNITMSELLHPGKKT